MISRLLLCIAALLATAVSVSAQSNNALSFDGVDDVVTAPAASSLIANAPGISMTAWVYPTNPSPNFPNFDGFAGFRNDVDADFYLLHLSPTNVEARMRNSAGQDFTLVSPVLTINTWTHLAMTHDGSWLRLYKNGVIADSMAASGTITNSSVDFLIGNLQFQITNFQLAGRMDEVSLWSRALSPEELRCLPVNGIDTASATGLQLYYRCNQGTAGGNNTGVTQLNDAAGNIPGLLNNFALNGNASNFVAGAQLINNVTLFSCPDSGVVFNGQFVPAPGVYTATFTNSAGCDSVVQLNLFTLNVDTAVSQNVSTLTANHVGTFYQWLDCNNGYAPVPGANGRTFTPSAVGSYAVIVQQSGCFDTSSCYTVNTLGLNNNPGGPSIRIFPSITSGKLTVETNGITSEVRIRIADLSGRLLYDRSHEASRNLELDLASYNSGVYTITVEALSGQSRSFRVVRQ